MDVQTPSPVPASPALPWSARVRRWLVGTTPGSYGIALLLAFGIFALLLLLVGRDPVATYAAIFQGTLGDSYGWGEIVVKMTPFILCALATAIPARVGLVNVGGEGQLLFGAIFATLVALAFGGVPAPLLIPMLLIGGMVGGALWAGVIALMRVMGKVNETISSLLLNYVALLALDYVVHGPLKDPNSGNWPYSAEFSANALLPRLGDTRISLGILFALLALIGYAWLMQRTRWGYEMNVIGGNSAAAHHIGLPTRRYIIIALLLGGAMAGIAGMIEVSAIQGRLRSGISGGYGYIGFLAAWLALNRPFGILGMAGLLGLLSVGGDVIQIGANLPAATTNVLMALILFCVLALTSNSAANRRA
jgi:simple sugar transport system permease protein